MVAAGQPLGVPDVMISKADARHDRCCRRQFNATTGVPATTVNVTINNDNQVISAYRHGCRHDADL